ncbi:MAG TPA: inositol monophosphatase family protein [Thermoanaerobaculia bacterium]|nr:inositol monophosphatase family protein [Thermoanaerobaculia bacterium]
MHRDLELAMQLAGVADRIAMRYFRSASLLIETKEDRTPVSEADLLIERELRQRIAAVHPDDAIFGEEYGVRGTSSRRWIIDPIDGTKNFIRGIPVFATLIALEDVAGVVSAPALGRQWYAARGEGAFCNGTRLHVSKIATIEEAHLTYDSITDFDTHGGTDAFLKLTRDCWRSRGFGDFWSHMMVAEGAVEIAIEPAVAAWDMAPVKIIIEEAGGRFTDLRGRATIEGGSALSTNGLLHDQVLERFA